MKFVHCVVFITLIATLVGCASIPPEAPELSAELGNRISAIEDANITLLNKFFDQKRAQVDKFIQEEWVPVFAEEFFSNAMVENAWNTIVKENDKKQRLDFLLKTGSALQKRINEKRLELIQPLDDLERNIERQIRDNYDQAKAMNNSITSFLVSASKVAENRNRYLGMIGVTDEKIGKAIDQTDEAVTSLLGKAKDVKDKEKEVEEFIGKVRLIKDSLDNKKGD